MERGHQHHRRLGIDIKHVKEEGQDRNLSPPGFRSRQFGYDVPVKRLKSRHPVSHLRTPSACVS